MMLKVRSCLAAVLAALVSTAAPAKAAPFDWAALRAVVDGPEGEAWISFHPSGEVVVFDRNTKDWKDHRFFMSQLVDGKWIPAQPVPFTSEYNGTSPRFSADGKSLLYSTSRPLPGAPPPAPDAKKDGNIWRVPWDGHHFGEPVPITAINSIHGEIEAVEVANGTIYFSSNRSAETNPKNKVDIYKAVPKGDGSYAISVVEGISTADYYESTQYVAPDEHLMLFSRGDDPVGLGHDDIFVSYNRDGKWTAPVHLKNGANSPTFEYGPEVAPDGKTLLVTSHRSGQAEIIAVPMPSPE